MHRPALPNQTLRILQHSQFGRNPYRGVLVCSVAPAAPDLFPFVKWEHSVCEMGLRKWTQADGGARLGKCAKLTSIAMSRVDERPPAVDIIALQQPFARTLAISGECLLHLASLLGQVHM